MDILGKGVRRDAVDAIVVIIIEIVACPLHPAPCFLPTEENTLPLTPVEQ